MKKLISVLTIFTVSFAFTGLVLARGAADIELTELENKVTVKPPSDITLDDCGLAKTNGTGSNIVGYAAGWQTVTYFDPATCPGVPTYPFEITALHFSLVDAYSSNPWPYSIDVVVYDMLQAGDPCQGPGAELCRFTVTCDQASFEWPNVGTATFPQVCCVNGPFFIGVDLTDPNPLPPSLMFDDQVPPCCDGWWFIPPVWGDWCWVFGDPPIVGYPLFWVDGETPPNNCVEFGCEDHKMHYPQLPDPNGWDVMATGNTALPNATTLADDWECSESGYVKDIHFWGSWFGDAEGEIMMFHVAIHDNIPQGPNGWSIPGEERWFREISMDRVDVSGPFTGNQGWYDPAGGTYDPDNHQLFYQYDILLDQDDWFYQSAGTVYWLRISAFVVDQAYQWGWKSSSDHFMDDAVWSPYAYPFEWTEMYEPDGGGGEPVVNRFWVAFDPGGVIIPELSGGTDYYDAGVNGWVWYYSDWWNIWFYNAPFDLDRYKEISTMGWVEKLEPSMPAWVEIAIDWSGPNWPPGQPPPIAPEEEEFIERLTILASDLPAGGEPFEIWEHIIPNYNPEWVSIDVRGFNFGIWSIDPGIIEHECIGAGQEQSLDLAFCITGEPATDIPTLNEWGMILLGLLLLSAGTVAVIWRRKAALARTN